MSNRELLPLARMMICLDLENLAGTSRISAAAIAPLIESVTCLVQAPAASNTHLVVSASSAQGALEAGLAAPRARLVWRPGHDGADIALLEVLSREDIATRYRTVVIGSGDGIFALLARSLHLAGVNVVVVSRPQSLSCALARSASQVLLLSDVSATGLLGEPA